MTVHGVADIYNAWVNSGGRSGYVGVYAVAVALAESGGNDQAISPSDDYGVWQINAVHAAEFPNLWRTRYNILSSAKMAIAISGNGADWGPWCTAWADPVHCGEQLGAFVQAGSPASVHVAPVASALGISSTPPGYQPPQGPVADGGTPGAAPWSRFQDILGPRGDSWHRSAGNALTYLRGFGA